MPYDTHPAAKVRTFFQSAKFSAKKMQKTAKNFHICQKIRIFAAQKRTIFA